MQEFSPHSLPHLPSLQSLSSPKIKNALLIRHSCSHTIKLNPEYQHPEASYIMKYAPKYYKNLTLELTRQGSLLSKVKKIKKLKTFTGLESRILRQQLLLNLLANTRKEIEEIPWFYSRMTPIFWVKSNGEMLKYLVNIARICPPRQVSAPMSSRFLDVFSLNEEYLCNMRRLKSIKILIQDMDYLQARWLLAKLDKMNRLLDQLETFNIEIKTTNQSSIEELFQYKNIFSHLTGLSCPDFPPEILQNCSRNLKSLALNFQNCKDQKSEIFNVLTSLHQMVSLKNLSFSLPEDAKPFWKHFKPQPSLRYLNLQFNASDLINEKNKDFVSHWEEIKDLEVLELKILCGPVREIMLARLLTTKILKKIGKLGQLNVLMEGALDQLGFQACCEPFVVEDVPHIYETLERFEYSLRNSAKGLDVKIDFKINKMKFFKNLKGVKLDGHGVCYDNLDKIVDLLQDKGDYPILEINQESKARCSWLGEALQGIQKIKRKEGNLKIAFNVIFKTETPYGVKFNNLLKVFEEFCENVWAVRTMRGLTICLSLHDTSFAGLSVDEVRKILEKYPGMRNVNACLSNYFGSIEYMNMEAKKTQFIVNKLW